MDVLGQSSTSFDLCEHCLRSLVLSPTGSVSLNQKLRASSVNSKEPDWRQQAVEARGAVTCSSGFTGGSSFDRIGPFNDCEPNRMKSCGS
eukprot:193568-Amphidinium_carterae.1